MADLLQDLGGAAVFHAAAGDFVLGDVAVAGGVGLVRGHQLVDDDGGVGARVQRGERGDVGLDLDGAGGDGDAVAGFLDVGRPGVVAGGVGGAGGGRDADEVVGARRGGGDVDLAGGVDEAVFQRPCAGRVVGEGLLPCEGIAGRDGGRLGGWCACHACGLWDGPHGAALCAPR
ncbi:MAG: hypothetical protein IPH64_21520 [Comamonadaceae bacterium]|nr:hypothetical protein [Comamonadaceae bacterium]